jgi:hypothetical protein
MTEIFPLGEKSDLNLSHSYLDDSLLKEFDSEILSRHTCLFIRLLLDLDFRFSCFPLGEKSDLNLSCNVPPKPGSLGKEVSETFSKKNGNLGPEEV